MYLDKRDALVAFIDPLFKTRFPGLPLVFENLPFDRSSQPAKFVEVEIEFHDSDQINLAVNPKTRVRGCVVATYTCRQGLGTRQALEVMGWFSETLKYRDLSGLQLASPQPEPGDPVAGWYRSSLRVNFHYDA